MTCILIQSVWTICCTLLITQPKWFPEAQCSSLKHCHCPKAQAYTWLAKPLLMGFKKTLAAALSPPQPSPSFHHIHASGERILLPPEQFSSLMLLSRCPYPSFFGDYLYILQNPTQVYLFEAFPSYPGRTACPLFLLMGRELYMPVFMFLQNSVEYRRYLSLFLTWEWTAQGMANVLLTYLCILRAQHSDWRVGEN